MTHTSNHSPEPNVTGFSRHLLTQSEKVDLALNIIKLSSPSQSVPPWITWHRPLSWLTSPTQDWTEKINLHSFYNASLDTTPTQTPPPFHKQLWSDQFSGILQTVKLILLRQSALWIVHWRLLFHHAFLWISQSLRSSKNKNTLYQEHKILKG